MGRVPAAVHIESELIERIYDTTLDQTLWHDVMQQVAAAMGGNYAGVFFFDLRARRPTRIISNDFPNREVYLRHYASIDNRNIFGLTAPAGLTFTDAAFIEGSGIARSPFYQEYLHPNDLGHVGAHMLQNDSGGVAGVAVQRPFRMAAFERT